MAKPTRRPERSADHPRHEQRHYKPGDDGPLCLVYNARGGVYVASVAVSTGKSSGPAAPELEHEPGDPPVDSVPRGARSTGPARNGAPDNLVMTLKLMPGLNLVGADRLRDMMATNEDGPVCPGFARRIADGDMLDLGELDAWPETKPVRAIDYVRNTGNADALRALLEVELRPQVGEVIERQLAEVSTDGGNRLRARRLARAHSTRD